MKHSSITMDNSSFHFDGIFQEYFNSNVKKIVKLKIDLKVNKVSRILNLLYEFGIFRQKIVKVKGDIKQFFSEFFSKSSVNIEKSPYCIKCKQSFTNLTYLFESGSCDLLYRILNRASASPSALCASNSSSG